MAEMEEVVDSVGVDADGLLRTCLRQRCLVGRRRALVGRPHRHRGSAGEGSPTAAKAETIWGDRWTYEEGTGVSRFSITLESKRQRWYMPFFTSFSTFSLNSNVGPFFDNHHCLLINYHFYFFPHSKNKFVSDDYLGP